MLFSYSVYVWSFAVAILSIDADTAEKPRSTCHAPIIFPNFDISRILGRWYMYSHHDHDFERGCDCFTTEVQETEANILQIASCCQVTRESNVTQKCNVGVNGARLMDPEKKEALFAYTRAGVSVETQVWIIDTDYDNYMIINACERVSDEKESELFWIMSRDTEINDIEATKINDVLKANHFETNKIIRQRHGKDICKSTRPEMEYGKRHRHGNEGRKHGISGEDN